MKRLARRWSLGLLMGLSLGAISPKDSLEYHEDAPYVILYQAGQQAIRPSQQHPGLEYWGDYPIFERIPLTQPQQDSLYYWLMKAELFHTDEVKKCPFEPAWALECSRGGKPQLKVLLSPSPCSRAYFIRPESKEWATIAPQNPLERALKRYGG